MVDKAITAAPQRDKPFEVVALRTTGVHPEAVAEMLEVELTNRHERWTLDRVEPIIYNSSTTGYILLIFARIDGRT